MPSILTARRALLFASALSSLLLIGGCGLKGDLILPEPTGSSASPDEPGEEISDDEAGDTAGAGA